MSERMFDSKFCDSVAKMRKCSLINDSMPFRYVSKMYDSKMSERSSVLDAEVRGETILEEKKEPKRLDEYDLSDLIQKFLKKDSIVIEPKIEIVA